MRLEFQDDSLDRLETDATFTGGYSEAIVRAYRKRIAVIRAAKNETDLYAFASWRFKKLQGARSHQHSIRLNDQYRLIVEVKESSPSNVIVVVSIEDYH